MDQVQYKMVKKKNGKKKVVKVTVIKVYQNRRKIKKQLNTR